MNSKNPVTSAVTTKPKTKYHAPSTCCQCPGCQMKRLHQAATFGPCNTCCHHSGRK